MNDTSLTNEKCANAKDMDDFDMVVYDKRTLNYDKYFHMENVECNKLMEFNLNNTKYITMDQIKEKLLELEYVRGEIGKCKKEETEDEKEEIINS